MSGYSQRDPAWAGIKLGPGPDDIGPDGCYLTTDAMTLTWMGATLTPAQLNQLYLAHGLYGAGCGECLPDDAMARLRPDLVQLAGVYHCENSPCDLRQLDNSDPHTFKCVELLLGGGLTHFAPVYDGTRGASSTILDPWQLPAAVVPISSYGPPSSVIGKIITWRWLQPPPPAPAPPPVPVREGYWPGQELARALCMWSASDGVKLDAWGGLHPVGGAAELVGGGYWPGLDIARDVALVPGTHCGFLLDGWGGLHPFAETGSTLPGPAQGFAYWKGWDIARRVLVLDQHSGEVLDAFGGRHPFTF